MSDNVTDGGDRLSAAALQPPALRPASAPLVVSSSSAAVVAASTRRSSALADVDAAAPSHGRHGASSPAADPLPSLPPTPTPRDTPSDPNSHTDSSSPPSSPRGPAPARATPETRTDAAVRGSGVAAATSAADVSRWKDHRDYQRLARELHKLLSAIDATPVAEWATQASLLGQLLKCLQKHKDVVGAVELPDGLHFAKALAQALSPLSVVGVQRKALEVLQCYAGYANPTYPMARDLPHVLPGLLELLPQATMQVKGDVLEILDRSLVRRLPAAALRASAQGLLTALLSCLEESETSPMYRRAMALLEFVQETLARATPTPSPPRLGEVHAGLRGGQVLAAHTWVLLRDAAPLRAPGLSAMKALIALSGVPAAPVAVGAAEGESEAESAAATPAPVQPDWVGGDAATVVAALLNCLQDAQERTHRLALDILLTVCPLAAEEGHQTSVTLPTPVGGGACRVARGVDDDGPTLARGAMTAPPWRGASQPVFTFERRALLVAAAVQLLGTRHGTVSVARRVLQWLTVDSGSVSSVADAGPEGAPEVEHRGGVVDDVTANPAAASASCAAYVERVTAYVLSHGFHMVVDHWLRCRRGRGGGGGGDGEATAAAPVPPHVSAALSALQHTAAQAATATAPRLSSASSVAAAFGSRRGGTVGATAAPPSTVPDAVAVAVVWLRALLVLLRYRASNTRGGAAPATAVASPAVDAALSYDVSEVAAAAAAETDIAVFLVHAGHLLLPSLCRLVAGVPAVLAAHALDGTTSSAAADLWAAELHELLQVLPWHSFVELDMCAVQVVERLLRPALPPSVAGSAADAVASTAAAHVQQQIAAQTNSVFDSAEALGGAMVDMTVECSAAAQGYVLASLRWSEATAVLLGRVVAAVGAEVSAASPAPAAAAVTPPALSLLLSTADALLRVLMQRVQQLMEPMLDAVLAAASATRTPSVVTVDFFSSFLSAVDACVLHHIRDAAAALTATALHTCPRATATCASGLQPLLARLHRSTLRITSFVAQLHLRCRQQALIGVLLDTASEDGAGARERDLAQATTAWLASVCHGATAAAAAGAHIFFARTVRLLLDVLLRARGCLLPEAVYAVLDPCCATTGGTADAVAFTDAYVLAPVLHRLWEACAGGAEALDLGCLPAVSAASAAAGDAAEMADMCTTALVALVAVSPACSRCLDTFVLETAADLAVPRLVRLQRELAELRAQQQQQQQQQQRRVPTGPLAPVEELQEPGILFQGQLALLDCLVGVPGDVAGAGAAMAEATRQLARAHLSNAIVRDLPGHLLPLHLSMLCPLVTGPPPHDSASGRPRRRSSSAAAADAGGPALSTSQLTVLLPVLTAAAGAEETTWAASPVRCSRFCRDEDTRVRGRHAAPPSRVYRCVEAEELVRYLFALLQLPSAVEWVGRSMDTPTPNALRVLLRALEAQSFVPSEAGDLAVPSTPPSPSSPAHAGDTNTLFAATALLLLCLIRHGLLSVHAVHMRHQDMCGRGDGSRLAVVTRHSSESSSSAAECAAALQRRSSTLLDAVGCLNRLVALSQTGPRTRPHPAAALTWQYTSAQLLPLLRLAVQADLHAVQSVLLDHIRGVALYLDDVPGTPSAPSPQRQRGRYDTGTTAGAASRHWRPHALQRFAEGGDGGGLGEAPAEAASRGAPVTSDAAAEAAGASATPVLEELKRAPPAVLSNKSLYAMLGEVVERVLSQHAAGAEASAAPVAPRSVGEDTLSAWLRLYVDVLPHLYRDLVPSAEIVVDVLLCALESTPGAAGGSADAATPLSGADEDCAAAQSICYAALADVAQYLFGLARAVDEEAYAVAMRAKESMSWIASTFTQEDPVAQARGATLWHRSPVLSPIRAALPRLVGAAARVLCVYDRTTAAAPPRRSGAYAAWAADADADATVGWPAARVVATEPARVSEPVERLCAESRRLLRVLSDVAGAEFVVAFQLVWCDVYAARCTWWVFEDKRQRQRRHRICAAGPAAAALDGIDADLKLAWGRKEEAQRAARVLLEDVGVPLSDVAAVLAPLLQSAASASTEESGTHGERPSRAAAALFSFDQLVEGHCAEHSGSLAERDVEAVLTVVADVLSQLQPDPLCFCCLFHTTYCVVDYAEEDRDDATAPTRTDEAPARCSGEPSRRQPRQPKQQQQQQQQRRRRSMPGLRAATDAAATLVTMSDVYRSRTFCFALCRLLEHYRVQVAGVSRSSALLSLQLLCQTLRPTLPSSLGHVDNAGRVVDAATSLLQRALLPVLRRGIASASEAEIVLCAPLVCAALRVLRALVAAFAPDLTFERRAQRDVLSLLFSEHFFRYSRGALHEWALLLREWCGLDPGLHDRVCERVVPSPGRLSAMLMSREAEAQLWERSLRTLGFYTYAVFSSEAGWRTTCGGNNRNSSGSSGSISSAGGATAAAVLSMPAARQTEFAHLLREQLTNAFSHFSSPTIPTVAELQRREYALPPVRAALFVFRVVLICGVRESLVASLWPTVLPELVRVLSITAAGDESAVEVDTMREIVATQMEALKVLDVDYTLYPAHALAVRWLFTDDASAPRQLSAPRSATTAPAATFDAVLTRSPAASREEALQTPPASSSTAAAPLDAAAAVVHAVHEPRPPTAEPGLSELSASSLMSVQRLWPASPRPPTAGAGLRRPLFCIPPTHYCRLHGVHRATQAFAALLHRLDLPEHPSSASASSSQLLPVSERLASVCAAVGACVGLHCDVDMVYLHDIVEADMTNTDPDTMQ
ncbi:Dopey, N-terminal [Novymonas esmeraldas]|uniref:Dopey, N-terminal n=1 Tax=Novymonas esmeraldas TaxID=1808958 RepID=A0AAW0ET04_9TRYP